MSDKVFIKYNGVDVFYPQSTPFIGLEEQGIYVDELWGRLEKMTLQGQLTGCTFNDIVQAQSQLLTKFNTPFQTLEIYQQTGSIAWKVFQKDLVEIVSMDFDQSRMIGALPYTINLACYPSGLFSGAYGILNPSDNWNFAEQQNATLDATHSISCQPFNTSNGPSNALDNARNWAFGRTGLNGMVAPILISGVSINDFCLLTQQETIDRFNGTYSLVENYTNDLARSGYGVIRYTTEISSGNNLITISLNGNAQGGGRNITGLRYAVSRLDKTAIALNAYQSVFARNDLNPTPLSQTIEENPYTTQIDFSYSYDNSNLPQTWFDYTVNNSVGTNGQITTSIQGTIYARGGDTSSKLLRAKAYASGINLYNLCLPFYNSFDVSSIVPLNSVPVNMSQTNNEVNGTVDLSASFNNNLQYSNAIVSLDASLNITPALPVYNAEPVLNGNGVYSVVGLNYRTRSLVNAQATAVGTVTAGESVAISAAESAAKSLANPYIGGGILTQSIITVTKNNGRPEATVTYEWSCPTDGGIPL